MDATEDFVVGALLRHPCTPSTQTGEMFHKHQCPHCAETWAHLDALPQLGLSRADFEEAHTCPRCGTKQYTKVVDQTELGKRAVLPIGREVWALF